MWENWTDAMHWGKERKTGVRGCYRSAIGSWGCRAGGWKGVEGAAQGRGEGGFRQIIHNTSLPRA